jgi:nitroreductase
MSMVDPDESMLQRALVSAVRAPSIYNSQPWRWRVTATDGVDLFADTYRHLIAVDPDRRDLLMSCGAALHHLTVALAGLGWSAQIDRFPDPEDPDHLAHLRPQTASPPLELARLAASIPRRRTDRRRFSDKPVDAEAIETLIKYCVAYGAELHVVAGDARRRLLGLITASASLQRQQMGYVAELAQWESRYRQSGDGIQSDTVPFGIARPGEVPMRAYPHATLVQSPHSFEHDDASTLMVLTTASDDGRAALCAGEATSAVLLAATDLGLATTPMSQPLEVAGTRALISEHLVGPQCTPQLVLRAGWAEPGAPDLPPTPRRRLAHVLMRPHQTFPQPRVG